MAKGSRGAAGAGVYGAPGGGWGSSQPAEGDAELGRRALGFAAQHGLTTGVQYDGPAGPVVDMVDHPPHYNRHPSGIECIVVVRHHNFNVGNAIKYLWRLGLKASEGDEVASDAAVIEDLEKARWYIADEIRRLGGTPR